MKKIITIIALLSTFAINAIAAAETVQKPLQAEFADKLVAVFGGKDKSLSEAELVRVLDFLQANLPEKTQPTSMTNLLSRQNNFYNTPRGEMTEERFSVRDLSAKSIAASFIEKYDSNKDLMIDNGELALALENVIGTPKARTGLGNGSLARK